MVRLILLVRFSVRFGSVWFGSGKERSARGRREKSRRRSVMSRCLVSVSLHILRVSFCMISALSPRLIARVGAHEFRASAWASSSEIWFDGFLSMKVMGDCVR